MYVKTSFFDILYEVQKDLQEVSAGTGIFFTSSTLEFWWYFDVKVDEANFDLAKYN
jgi:hypothetical protein